ncbi:NUDIX domain-containing protein [Hydrogenophaga sp.]|uniref:NUDIX domain-containing protein n=1 Tax=Hydrogenophaga sp. TaxID=1904254 RepID=UPI003F6EBD43
MNDDDPHLREIPVSRTELLQGQFLHVVRDTVRLPSGAQATREYVLHPGAVMIIGLLDDGRVVLERQFRHPMQAVMIEFPAGKVDRGEDRLVCAQRELLEETGYRASEWAFAGRLAPTIAYSDEIIDIWFARGLTPGERALDDGEFLDVIAATPDELKDWCFTGKVIDCKTLIGSMWLQNVLRGEWALSWQSLAAATPAGESGA